jgi:hypothetical protein
MKKADSDYEYFFIIDFLLLIINYFTLPVTSDR